MATDSTNESFDWVSAQAGCRIDLMFRKLLDGARADVDRRNASAFGRSDGWRFEFHVDDENSFEVTRATGNARSTAFVAFEREGPHQRYRSHGSRMMWEVGMKAAATDQRRRLDDSNLRARTKYRFRGLQIRRPRAPSSRRRNHCRFWQSQWTPVSLPSSA